MHQHLVHQARPLQVSNDVRMLLPLLVGILVAKWVADAATHSLYHALLEVACIPWLAPAPAAPSSMDLLPVSSVMASPVVTLPVQVSLGELREVLRDSRHHGFPVVRPTPAGMVSPRIARFGNGINKFMASGRCLWCDAGGGCREHLCLGAERPAGCLGCGFQSMDLVMLAHWISLCFKGARKSGV